MGIYAEDRARLFLQVHRDRTGDNRHKSEHGNKKQFHWKISVAPEQVSLRDCGVPVLESYSKLN